MNQLLEWSPLLAFFVTFKLLDIYWATGVLMIACTAVAVAHRLQSGRWKTMQLFTAALALVLGGATLLLHDKRFIQWKPTVLLAAAALAFLGSSFIGEQPLARRLLESAFDAPLAVSAAAWRRLNILWSAWFLLLSAANLAVARTCSENVWVNFKFFGLPAALMVFMLPQVFWLASRVKPKPVEQT